MVDQNKRLGRGLSSLISDPKASKLASQLETTSSKAISALSSEGRSPLVRIQMIRLESIVPNPRQPRRAISANGISRLAMSIKQNGVIQPVVVRPVVSATSPVVSELESESGSVGAESSQTIVKYELIAGERRWLAAKESGLSDVPAIIREADDSQLIELALVENIQREDLNAIDRAMAYKCLRDLLGLTPRQMGRRVGEDRTTVTNYLRLLELPDEIRQMISRDLISMGHARALLGVDDPALQFQLAQAVVVKELSVRALEEMVRRQRYRGRPRLVGQKGELEKRPHIRDLEQQFIHALQTKVTIQENRRGNKGKIIIEYNSLEDFDRIFAKLGI